MKLILALIVLVGTNAAAFAVSNDPVETAYFQETLRKSPSRSTNQIGNAYSSSQGYGIVFKKAISGTRNFLIEGSFKLNRLIPMLDFTPSPLVENADIIQKRHLRMAFGAEQSYIFSDNLKWALVGNLAGTLNKDTYEVRYYPRVCNWLVCGFNPNVYTQQYREEEFLETVARLGISYQTRIFDSMNGAFVFMVESKLGRWPQQKPFTGPDGRNLNVPTTGDLIAQLMIQL